MRTHWFAALSTVVMIAVAGSLSAQNTKMPSTLRFGSGIIDVPVASVLPHLAITGTYSGFWAGFDYRILTNSRGNPVALGSPVDNFYQDGSIAIGLFDRAEIGGTFQSFNDEAEGGSMVGVFGRIALLRPQAQGLGLAVGARYVTAPDYGDGIDYQPGRLGFPDPRFQNGLAGHEEIDTEFTPYVVGSLSLRGFEGTFLPDHDFTVTGGWGDGMFTDIEDPSRDRRSHSEGWFVGSAVHMLVSDNALLNLMGEYNGFDVNFGAQLDFGGIRVGGFALGTNYFEEISVYRDIKYGILASIAMCPTGEGFLCSPSLIDRPEPEIREVQLPAPPPDTVTITVNEAPPLPTGTAATICLATGQEAQVLVTAQGDTLVGPGRVSVRSLRPGVVFAGNYAAGAEWFEEDETVTFEERAYQKTGGEVRLNCPEIMRVGEFNGVPLFARRDATAPYQTLYAPVSPGIWQAYQQGLGATRGNGGGGSILGLAPFKPVTR
jgi:hypothetical protein